MATSSDIDDTVIEQVESWSHELRVFWELGDRFTATSGVYQFWESRDQWYGIRERAGQGRARNAALYGPEGFETWVQDGIGLVGWVMPGCIGQSSGGSASGGDLDFNDATHPGYGQYCGDPGEPYKQHVGGGGDTGAVYEHRNLVDNENFALYTQGDLTFTDTFSVTLGVRYSKDWRDATEQRGGYSEIEVLQQAVAAGGAGRRLRRRWRAMPGEPGGILRPRRDTAGCPQRGAGRGHLYGRPGFPHRAHLRSIGS